MPRKPTLLVLAVLAASPLPLSSRLWASPSDATDTQVSVPPLPMPVPAWGHPPEAVRTAAAALRDACAAWPKQIPLATQPPPPPDTESSQHAKACSFALDPDDYTFTIMLEGAAAGAAGAGIAVATYAVAKLLLSALLEMVARWLAALWARYRRRHQSWPE